MPITGSGSGSGGGSPGANGRGIVSVVRTAGDGTPGSVDTYTITYTDATTSTFNVTNGHDGQDGSGTGLTQTAADARYQRQPGLVDQLPTPFYIAHRGGGTTGLPEESIEAYDNIVQRGFLLECDLWTLADGTLVPMHDSTVDRTSTGTGNVSSFTPTTWRQLRLKPLDGGGTGVQPPPPTWTDVLDKYGGRYPISAETKVSGNTVIDAFIDTIARRGLKREVLHTSFNYADCQRVLAAGIESAPTGDALDPATVRADGFRYITCSNSATSGYVASHVALGTKVIQYVYDTASGAQAAITAGASGIYSNDPGWVTQRYPRSDRDNFAGRVGWSGWAAPAGFNFRRDEFGIGVNGAAAGSGVVPFFNIAAPGSTSRWRWRLRWTPTSTSTGGTVGLFIGTVSAASATSVLNGSSLSITGYQARMSRDGSIAVDKVTANAAATTASDTTDPAIATTADVFFDLQLEITGTQVILTNLTTGKSATLTDAAYRSAAPVLVAKWSTANAYLSRLSVEAL